MTTHIYVHDPQPTSVLMHDGGLVSATLRTHSGTSLTVILAAREAVSLGKVITAAGEAMLNGHLEEGDVVRSLIPGGTVTTQDIERAVAEKAEGEPHG